MQRSVSSSLSNKSVWEQTLFSPSCPCTQLQLSMGFEGGAEKHQQLNLSVLEDSNCAKCFVMMPRSKGSLRQLWALTWWVVEETVATQER